MTTTLGQASCVIGADPARVALFACAERCEPIPWQLDERDGDGEYVLDQGPQGGRDGDGGLIDANDELVFMWSDMSDGLAALPGRPACVEEIAVTLGAESRRVFAVVFDGPAPRSAVRYVDYDAAADRMLGGQVNLTFAGPTPRGLALRHGVAAGRDLLDRLKIRAQARFFGLFPLHRDEDDILSVYEAWRVGPIRVIRRERKWVELAFGFRTPYMRTETTFYRDFAQLPVRLRLNYPPASLLSGIELRAALDFANLKGWRLWIPANGAGADTFGPFEVGAVPSSARRRLDEISAPVIALQGADTTIALALRLGPSLQCVRKTIFYSESTRPDRPEDVPGNMPAIGFRLTDWTQVDRGQHWFVAEAYSLPPGYDPVAFAADRAVTPVVSTRRRADLASHVPVGPRLTAPSPIH